MNREIPAPLCEGRVGKFHWATHQLLMALEYLREYRTYFHIGNSYGISESSAYKAIKWIKDTLIKHPDIRLFKESKVRMHPRTRVVTDTGYQGIQKIYANSAFPKKRSKKNPLTKHDKKGNTSLAREHVLNENVMGMLKRFKIITDKYRNRRKRFGLRFNLIAALYNLEIKP